MTAGEPLLGVSGRITTAQAHELIEDLTKAWAFVYGRPVGDLDSDLELCRFWFDPVAQGQRLRREISRLDPMPEGISDPQHPLTLRVDDGKWLVTPEGRCALDLLMSLPKSQAFHDVSAAQTAHYDQRLARLYRDWCRHRLRSVVALLSGTNKPLQVAAAGIVVALLVNRSTSEQRALIRYTTDPARSVVDNAFFVPVQQFADVLAPSRRRSGISARLISGWMLYEARRRIGDALVVSDGGAERNGAVWIQALRESSVIDTVARDLVRGHRARVTADKFVEAFDRLVVEMRRESKALAGFGLAHERPRDTQRLRGRFVDRLLHYAETQK